MEKRAAKWPAVIPTAEVATYANTEFVKALRTIHVQVSRNTAAAKAVAQLEAPEGEVTDDDQAA
jgi:hypothetical protein